ncbi:MAG: TRAP transporter large permease subunit, partial [bacterium]
ATAFVMASFLGVPYITVAIAAVIPSLLYFYGLFVQIDAYAARNNIHGLPREELPKALTTLKEGWYYVFAFFLLIYLLVYLHRESHAPFYATGVLLLLSQIRTETRMNLKKFLAFVESIGKLLAELVAVLAAVGLIIGGLMVTGMAGTFSGDLVRLAGGNVPLLLLLGALTSFILGIGMTVTAAYIFLAIVLAPALVNLGLDPVAVHLFILYWGMISFITPPVALGAYAAASLAGSKPIETGFEAMRLGSIIYFLPFFFVLNPALIFHAGPLDVIMELSTALLGVSLLASGLQGYLVLVGKLETTWPALITRALLIVGGLLLAYPEMYTNLIGVVVCIPAVLIGKRINRPVLAAEN